MSNKSVPGSIDSSGNKQGTFLEGEQSRPHEHNSGSSGRDVEAFRNTYKDDKVVHREKASDWGKIHNDNDYADYDSSGDSGK